MRTILALVFAYLVGSVPVGYLVGQYARGIDIRRYGSGNIGTTNVFRVLGTGPGLAVLAGDISKGVLAVLVGRAVGGNNLALVCGLLAISGHNWSLFLNFNGGRGVATAGGVILALVPDVVVVAVAVWAVTVVLSRYVSLGSLLASVTVPVFMIVFQKPWTYFLFGLIAAAIIVYRHRPNIRRLLSGTEFKLGDRSR